METIMQMIRHVTVFLLLSSLLGNLFLNTEYKKFFSYATGLIVVIMVLTPVLQILGKENDWKNFLIQADYRQEAEKTKEEIQLLGQKYEQKIQEQYTEQIRKNIAEQCGTTKENCEVRWDGKQIQFIRVYVNKIPEQVSSLVSSLALCYGAEEEKIFIVEGSQRNAGIEKNR